LYPLSNEAFIGIENTVNGQMESRRVHIPQEQIPKLQTGSQSECLFVLMSVLNARNAGIFVDYSYKQLCEGGDTLLGHMDSLLGIITRSSWCGLDSSKRSV